MTVRQFGWFCILLMQFGFSVGLAFLGLKVLLITIPLSALFIIILNRLAPRRQSKEKSW